MNGNEQKQTDFVPLFNTPLRKWSTICAGGFLDSAFPVSAIQVGLVFDLFAGTLKQLLELVDLSKDVLHVDFLEHMLCNGGVHIAKT